MTFQTQREIDVQEADKATRIVFWVAFLATVVLVAGLLIACGNAFADEIPEHRAIKAIIGEASAYTDNQIVDAIYRAEGGKKAQFPYGIRSIKCSGEQECRQICLNTVRNNRKRFAKQNKYNDFISFLGSRYCPVGADNDPQGLNNHWVKNVRYFLVKNDN